MRHIFLDIDNTMVCVVGRERAPLGALPIDSKSSVVLRPHLARFLTTAKMYFDTVNVWTAGGASYAKWISDNVISPVTGAPDLVLSDVHNRASLAAYGRPKRLKSLRELWGMCRYDERDCLLVDDLEENCAGQNSVLVPPFDGVHPDDVLARTALVVRQAASLSCTA